VSTDKQLKIGDLGVGKVLKAGMTYTQVGTPYYISPEIWRKQPYNQKSDVWSLGCVLYELITFRHPFVADSPKALAQKIMAGRYAPISSSYSRDLARITNLLLETDQRRRPSLPDILAMPEVQSRMHLVPEAIRAVAHNPRAAGTQKVVKTIKVPRNLHMLKENLPSPAYPGKTARRPLFTANDDDDDDESDENMDPDSNVNGKAEQEVPRRRAITENEPARRPVPVNRPSAAQRAVHRPSAGQRPSAVGVARERVEQPRAQGVRPNPRSVAALGGIQAPAAAGDRRSAAALAGVRAREQAAARRAHPRPQAVREREDARGGNDRDRVVRQVAAQRGLGAAGYVARDHHAQRAAPADRVRPDPVARRPEVAAEPVGRRASAAPQQRVVGGARPVARQNLVRGGEQREQREPALRVRAEQIRPSEENRVAPAREERVVRDRNGGRAKPSGGVDISEEIERIKARRRALQDIVNRRNGNGVEPRAAAADKFKREYAVAPRAGENRRVQPGVAEKPRISAAQQVNRRLGGADPRAEARANAYRARGAGQPVIYGRRPAYRDSADRRAAAAVAVRPPWG
jgi:Protein kinase domain